MKILKVALAVGIVYKLVEHVVVSLVIKNTINTLDEMGVMRKLVRAKAEGKF